MLVHGTAGVNNCSCSKWWRNYYKSIIQSLEPVWKIIPWICTLCRCSATCPWGEFLSYEWTYFHSIGKPWCHSASKLIFHPKGETRGYGFEENEWCTTTYKSRKSKLVENYEKGRNWSYYAWKAQLGTLLRVLWLLYYAGLVVILFTEGSTGSEGATAAKNPLPLLRVYLNGTWCRNSEAE